MSLKKLIAKRVLLIIPTVLGVVTLIFVALIPVPPIIRVFFYLRGHGVGGDPYNMLFLNQRLKEFGLDRPIFLQWLEWIGNVARLDFGASMSSGASPMQLVFRALPTTLELILYSAPLIILFAVWLGTKAALNHNRPVDHVARIAATAGATLPVFLLAAIAVATPLFFYNQLHFMPIEGLSYDMRMGLLKRIENGTFSRYTGLNTIDALLNGDMQLFLDAAAHLVLPVLVLVFTQGVALMRVTRSSLVEELRKQYITSALAKGLTQKDAAYKHARKNALVSVITLSGVLLGNMVTGLVIVERVFMIPGFCNLLVYSAIRYDIPVVVACSTFAAIVFVLVNLAVDILYRVVDPRIRLQ